MRLFHWLFLACLWSGGLMILGVVVHVALRIGHLPSYDNPDPKCLDLPLGVVWLTSHAFMQTFFSLVLVLGSSLYSKARGRPGSSLLEKLLTVGGVILAVGVLQFFDWWAD